MPPLPQSPPMWAVCPPPRAGLHVCPPSWASIYKEELMDLKPSLSRQLVMELKRRAGRARPAGHPVLCVSQQDEDSSDSAAVAALPSLVGPGQGSARPLPVSPPSEPQSPLLQQGSSRSRAQQAVQGQRGPLEQGQSRAGPRTPIPRECAVTLACCPPPGTGRWCPTCVRVVWTCGGAWGHYSVPSCHPGACG